MRIDISLCVAAVFVLPDLCREVLFNSVITVRKYENERIQEWQGNLLLETFHFLYCVKHFKGLFLKTAGITMEPFIALKT